MKVGQAGGITNTIQVGHATKAEKPSPQSDSSSSSSDRIDISAEEEGSLGALTIPDFGSWAGPQCGSDPAPSANVTERASVSVAYTAPAESREGTDSNLVLSKHDNASSERSLGDQLGVQQRAQDESRRKADQAQSSSEQLAGSQKILSHEKSTAEDDKSARRLRTEDGEKRVQVGEKDIDNHTSLIEVVKNAGDRLQTQQCDGESKLGQVENDLGAADTQATEAKQQVKEVEQQQQQAQTQEKTEKSEGPPGQAKKEENSAPGQAPTTPAPAEKPETQGEEKSHGNGKGKGHGAPAPEVPKSAPPPSAEKEKPGAKPGDKKDKTTSEPKTLQQKATQAQVQHAAAEQRKKALEQQQTRLKNANEQRHQAVEQTRNQLQEAQSQRLAGAGALKTERANLQTDVDAVRDLGAKSQAISNQMEQTRAGMSDLQGARSNNRENAEAAGRNADKLRGMQKVVQQRVQADEVRKSATPTPTSNDDDLKRLGGKDRLSAHPPANSVGVVSAGEPDPNGKAAGSRGNFNTYETQDATQISMESLNQGLSGGQFDQSNALGKSQGFVSDGQKFGDTSLASGSAAQAASGNSGGGGNETISSGGGGGGYSSGPGNSDFGHSRGKGKGKD